VISKHVCHQTRFILNHQTRRILVQLFVGVNYMSRCKINYSVFITHSSISSSLFPHQPQLLYTNNHSTPTRDKGQPTRVSSGIRRCKKYHGRSIKREKSLQMRECHLTRNLALIQRRDTVFLVRSSRKCSSWCTSEIIDNVLISSVSLASLLCPELLIY